MHSHFGVALLAGCARAATSVQHGGQPRGSRGYAQTFGDAWDKEAKSFLKEVLAGRSAEQDKTDGPAGVPAAGVAHVLPRSQLRQSRKNGALHAEIPFQVRLQLADMVSSFLGAVST